MDFFRIQEVHVFERPLADVKAFIGGSVQLESGPAPHTSTRGIVRLSSDDMKRVLAAYTVTAEVRDDFIRMLPEEIITAIRDTLTPQPRHAHGTLPPTKQEAPKRACESGTKDSRPDASTKE